MRAAEELYRAAKSLDDAATLAEPLAAFSDAIVPAAQFKALCRALRVYERHAAEEAADPTPRTHAVLNTSEG